jgi:cytochrome c oxidase subunit 3
MDIVSNQQRKKLHPYKFTLWVAIASIVMMFAGLTSAFIVKSNLVGWSKVGMPVIFWYSTAAILISSMTAQMALRSFEKRDMRKYRSLTAVTLALGIFFIILQWLGFQELWEQNIRFSGSAGSGQFLYVIFGLHGIHVLGGVIALIIMFLRAFFGKVRSYSIAPVEVATTYWHFVDILWIYLLIFFIVIG